MHLDSIEACFFVVCVACCTLLALMSLQIQGSGSLKCSHASEENTGPDYRYCQGPPNGGVSNGGVSRSGLVLPFVRFCPFWDFPDFSGIFPICSGMVRGFSRLVPFLFLSLLRAPTRNSPERVRDTIWTRPEKNFLYRANGRGRSGGHCWR